MIDKTGDNALHSNDWESEINLEKGTTYYWKVKARSDKTIGTWSAVSAFTTESDLLTPATTATSSQTTIVPAVQVQLPNTPQPVNINLNIPSWVLFAGGALITVIVITLAVLVIVTVRHRQ